MPTNDDRPGKVSEEVAKLLAGMKGPFTPSAHIIGKTLLLRPTLRGESPLSGFLGVGADYRDTTATPADPGPAWGEIATSPYFSIRPQTSGIVGEAATITPQEWERIRMVLRRRYAEGSLPSPFYASIPAWGESAFFRSMEEAGVYPAPGNTTTTLLGCPIKVWDDSDPVETLRSLADIAMGTAIYLEPGREGAKPPLRHTPACLARQIRFKLERANDLLQAAKTARANLRDDATYTAEKELEAAIQEYEGAMQWEPKDCDCRKGGQNGR